MLLCDIGNTHFHIYDNGRVYKETILSLKDKEIYYISVNEEKEKQLLSKNRGYDLQKILRFDTPYEGMGIDRKMACKTVHEGVIVDAGSAITIDRMQNGIHQGGTILPGLHAYHETFCRISPKLNYNFTNRIDLDTLPLNTRDAVSFGVIKSIIVLIESMQGEEKLFLTGGDATFLAPFCRNYTINETLVFEGMLEIIKDRDVDGSFA